jgi:large subunit ribosomal protein L13
MTQTTFATTDDHTRATRTWYVVDASQHVLGRVAVRIAEVLMGKHLPLYTPHISVGEGVIVINAAKARVTGNKREGKVYRRYSGYVGGLKEHTFDELIARDPEGLVKAAVRRMLPKNLISKQMLARLKVYSGAEHPHQAQKPVELKI